MTAPLPLAGFADRTEPYTSIRSRLEANILLLRPFDDSEALISLISPVRRTSVIVSFLLGIVLFGEKHVVAKGLCVAGIVGGVLMLS